MDETLRATLYDGTRGVTLTVGPGWTPEVMSGLRINTDGARFELQGHELSRHLHVVEQCAGALDVTACRFDVADVFGRPLGNPEHALDLRLDGVYGRLPSHDLLQRLRRRGLRRFAPPQQLLQVRHAPVHVVQRRGALLELVRDLGEALGPRFGVAEVRRHIPREILQLPRYIGRFAALARLSAVFLGHDSGPMHVVAAVGTPVVALYGSQNAALFRPAGEGHTLLQPPLPCIACVSRERCIPADSYRNLCVQNLPLSRVQDAVRAALAKRKMSSGTSAPA